MDALDYAMQEAERLGFGVSYGKYKAAHPNGGGCISTLPEQKAVSEKPVRKCVRCGKAFSPTHGNQTYCCAYCADEAKSAQQEKLRKKRHLEKKLSSPKFCKMCGATIIEGNRTTYCSKECEEDGHRKQSKQRQQSRPYVEVKCTCCGIVFKTQNPRRKTCSEKCCNTRREETLILRRADKKAEG